MTIVGMLITCGREEEKKIVDRENQSQSGKKEVRNDFYYRQTGI